MSSQSHEHKPMYECSHTHGDSRPVIFLLAGEFLKSVDGGHSQGCLTNQALTILLHLQNFYGEDQISYRIPSAGDMHEFNGA